MEQNIQNVNILIELAEDFFFLEICSPWMELALHPFFGQNALFPPPKKKNCLFFSEIRSPRTEHYTLFLLSEGGWWMSYLFMSIYVHDICDSFLALIKYICFFLFDFVNVRSELRRWVKQFFHIYWINKV